MQISTLGTPRQNLVQRCIRRIGRRIGRRSRSPLASLVLSLIPGMALTSPAALGQTAPAPAPTVVRNPITVLSDIQESNSEAGTVVARGNVFVDYPARNLEATSAQAQYFSNERRLILSGDVLVLQEGNSLRAETVTYLVDEGRMIALPLPNRQVESIYLIPETSQAAQPGGPAPIDESLLNGTPDGETEPTPADPNAAPSTDPGAQPTSIFDAVEDVVDTVPPAVKEAAEEAIEEVIDTEIIEKVEEVIEDTVEPLPPALKDPENGLNDFNPNQGPFDF